jgi:hypothetical protein
MKIHNAKLHHWITSCSKFPHHLQVILSKVIQLVTKISARRAKGAGMESNQKPLIQNS